MSIAPLAAGRYSIRGSRLTTHNVEERFRLEGPGQAAGQRPEGPPARVRRRPGDHAPAALEGRHKGEVKPQVKVQLNRSGSLASRLSRV
jgi:hypothetical protein